MADITTAVTNALKPLQEKLDAQQTEITNLRQLQNSGAADASQGAPPVAGATNTGKPEAPASPRVRTVTAFAAMPVFAKK